MPWRKNKTSLDEEEELVWVEGCCCVGDGFGRTAVVLGRKTAQKKAGCSSASWPACECECE